MYDEIIEKIVTHFEDNPEKWIPNSEDWNVRCVDISMYCARSSYVSHTLVVAVGDYKFNTQNDQLINRYLEIRDNRITHIKMDMLKEAFEKLPTTSEPKS